MHDIPSIARARGGWYVVAATFFLVKLSPDICTISDGLSASVPAMMPHILQILIERRINKSWLFLDVVKYKESSNICDD